MSLNIFIYVLLGKLQTSNSIIIKMFKAYVFYITYYMMFKPSVLLILDM